MRTITSLFDTYDHAASAVRSLKDAGIDSADISLVANSTAGGVRSETAEEAGEGAAAGAGVGAVAGGGAASSRASARSPFPVSGR